MKLSWTRICMLLRLQSPDRARIVQMVQEIFRRERVEEWREGLAIVSDYKLRLLLPEGAL